MTEVSYCAIAALAEEPLKASIVALSQRMEKDYGSWYVLSADRFPPHLTFWLAYLPSRNLTAIGRALLSVAEELERFSVRIEGFEVEDSGFVSLSVVDSQALRDVHSRLLRALNPLRQGYIPPKYAEKLSSYPPDQVESITNFGTRFAGRLFSPHLTLGVVKPEHVLQARAALRELTSASFDVGKLTLFRQREEGRSIEVLKEVVLQDTSKRRR